MNKYKSLILFFMAAAFSMNVDESFAAQRGRTVDLFPATVIADIKETGRIAKAVETEMESVIANLDRLKRQYTELDCDYNIADSDCVSLRKQIETSYHKDLLSILSNNLPQILKNIERTRVGLETQLRRNIGQNMTPDALQRMLSESNKEVKLQKKTSRTTRSSRGSRARLSDRFEQYHRLVSNTSAGGSNNLTMVAADIYLDMADSSDLIAMTQQEIQRMQIISELNESMGTLSPEMDEVVADVKVILFGEDYSDAEAIPEPPEHIVNGSYRSPFER